jgi:hypothetical protein
MNGCPPSSNATTSTWLAGCPWISCPGSVCLVTLVTREFLKSEVYRFAASSAWPLNQRQGVILFEETDILVDVPDLCTEFK